MLYYVDLLVLCYSWLLIQFLAPRMSQFQDAETEKKYMHLTDRQVNVISPKNYQIKQRNLWPCDT